MYLRIYYLPVLIVIFFLIGCSGGNNAPISPPGSASSIPGTLDNIPIFNLTETGEVTHATGMLGAWELTINPQNLTAELVSKRTSAIGESFILSGIKFVTLHPCDDCLRIIEVIQDEFGNLWLEIEVTHPYQPGDPDLPPSLFNRLDLDVFDLAMVLHPFGTPPQTFTQSGIGAYNVPLLGAAGYTTEPQIRDRDIFSGNGHEETLLKC